MHLSRRSSAAVELLHRFFPRLHGVLRKVAIQALKEWKMLPCIRPRDIIGRKREWWRRELPLQSVPRIVLPAIQAASAQELVAELESSGIVSEHGKHTIYLPPAALRNAAFAPLARAYPPDAGVKISKNTGPAEGTEYLHGDGQPSLLRVLLHDHRRMGLVTAILHVEGLGPRPYGVVDLELGATFPAHVVRHVAGRTPSLDECEHGIERLHDLERRRVLRIVVPGRFDHKDFRCPSCNGNALVIEESSGQVQRLARSANGAGALFQYVDFQNFVLDDLDAYLEELAEAAAGATHLSEIHLVGGRSHLNEIVPGLAREHVASIQHRGALLADLLVAAGESVENRLVLDIGCDLGMMSSQWLRLGAAWCHGWDDPRVTLHAERMLLALGCTRFSLSGVRLDFSYRLEDDLPAFLRLWLDGCVVSYLAVRKHLGWMDALARIPWSLLVYEGHEGETERDFERHVSELSRLVPVEIASLTVTKGGVSAGRVLAILRRTRPTPASALRVRDSST